MNFIGSAFSRRKINETNYCAMMTAADIKILQQ
jgi:hypothetical protein